MNKIVLTMSLMVFVLTAGSYKSHAEEWSEPTNSSTQCEYSVEDALKSAKSFVVVGFVPKKESADGKKVMGMVLFHNPSNTKSDSVDAVALVIVNKENPDVNQVILLVSYYNEVAHTTTTYTRRLENVKGKQIVSLCFNKTIEKVK